MERLLLIKENLQEGDEHTLNVSKADVEWLISKFEELETYTRRTRERWVTVHQTNSRLEEALNKIVNIESLAAARLTAKNALNMKG